MGYITEEEVVKGGAAEFFLNWTVFYNINLFQNFLLWGEGEVNPKTTPVEVFSYWPSKISLETPSKIFRVPEEITTSTQRIICRVPFKNFAQDICQKYL